METFVSKLEVAKDGSPMPYRMREPVPSPFWVVPRSAGLVMADMFDNINIYFCIFFVMLHLPILLPIVSA